MVRVGAPPGGRVHWLLLHLPREFARAYTLRYDYLYHNYHFTRYDKRTIVDEFIVVRTSRRCFRVMFFSWRYNYFEYFSEKTSKACAAHMQRVFAKMKLAEWLARVEQ